MKKQTHLIQIYHVNFSVYDDGTKKICSGYWRFCEHRIAGDIEQVVFDRLLITLKERFGDNVGLRIDDILAIRDLRVPDEFRLYREESDERAS